MLFFSLTIRRTFESMCFFKSASRFNIPDTFLPLINCRRQTIVQIIFPRQGNTAWINSITWYSLSSECGQFSRRSVPFFFNFRDYLVTSLQSPSRTRRDKQNRRARKCWCWHCFKVWTCQGEQIPGVGQGGYYVNLVAKTSSCMLVDLILFACVCMCFLVIIDNNIIDVQPVEE